MRKKLTCVLVILMSLMLIALGLMICGLVGGIMCLIWHKPSTWLFLTSLISVAVFQCLSIIIDPIYDKWSKLLNNDKEENK